MILPTSPTDFSERIRQLYKVVEAAKKGQTALKELTVWLGQLTNHIKHGILVMQTLTNPTVLVT